MRIKPLAPAVGAASLTLIRSPLTLRQYYDQTRPQNYSHPWRKIDWANLANQSVRVHPV